MSANPTRNAAPQRASPQTRLRRSFAISVLGAFALNTIAVGVFAAVATRWQAPGRTAPNTTWITAVATERMVAHGTPEDSSAPPPVPVVPTPPRPVLAALASPPAAALRTPAPQGQSDEEGAQVRFYRFGEVDTPAQPESDWNLDAAALDVAGVETLVFEIFVGSSGDVVDCRVLEPATLAAEVRESLEQRLRQTVLQPAMRVGMAVPSVRRIEVSVQSFAQ